MRFVLALLLCFPVGLLAQLSMNDDFNDGDFTANPAWSGNTFDFEVLAGELHLNNPTPASNETSYLSTPSNILDNGNWQFYFRFEQNPSSSNYGRVYLASDQADLKGALNGYYVDFGQAGDKIRLMRQSGTSASVVIESNSGLLNTSTVEARVQVSRDGNGLWTLLADTGSVVNSLVNIGTPTTDKIHTSSAFMGVFCRYTVTRASAFYFDEFNCSGQPNLDVTPPGLDTLMVPDIFTLKLQFNEPLDPGTAQQISNYLVSNGIGQPTSASLGGSNNTEVTLNFVNSFANGNSYTLDIIGLEDTSGNAATLTKSFTVNDPPARILSARPLSTTSVRLTFSEAVASAFALNPSNFTVDNGVGSPSSTSQPQPGQVELQFASSLQTGINYRLVVQGIQDDFGNLSTDTAFFRLGTINIFDDFSDGDFTNDPNWSGSAADFEIDASNQLHLNALSAGTSYLSTPSAISENAQWQFYLKMDFATSGSNFARVYVISQNEDLNDSTTNGYFVLIGGANDEISLFRQEENTNTPIIQSATGLIDTDPVELVVQVQIDGQGVFTLAADTLLDGSFFSIGSGTDLTFASSAYFGLYCAYTSSRTDLFYFDDFDLSGDPFIDDQAPVLTGINALNTTTLELSFNESLAASSAEDETSYTVAGGPGQPTVAQLSAGDNSKVVLAFSSAFQNGGAYTIEINSLTDNFGNTLDTTASFTFFIPEAGSVVINEIMADPEPVAGVPPNALPEREYLELYNRESVPVNLQGWTLQMGSSEEVLPFYELSPHAYVVLTQSDGVSEFDPSIPVLGLDMSSTVLTNGGKDLSLLSKEGTPIFTVSYTGDWYRDANKDDGGWSLEQIDPDNLCGGAANWAASEDPVGGTPGRENSLFGQNPDTTRPGFDRIAILGDSLIRVTFTEKVDELLLSDESNYRIEPSLNLDFAEPQAPAYASVILHFNEAIDPNTVYRLSLLRYPMDCSNNRMLPDSLLFTIPSVPAEGDIVINELLFNPPSGGADFVELYNNSSRLFDLQYLRLGHINMGSLDDTEIITEESFLFEPGRYLALTTDKAFLLDNYTVPFPENIVEVQRLPSLPDDEGSIVVATSFLEVIDWYEYSEQHHLSLIDPEGVSLERLSFEGPSNDASNWQSAASTVGYATPGYKNSQQLNPGFELTTGVEPKVFSPNQDGYHDVVSLTYSFERPNNVLSVSIWNASGYKLRTILENQNISMQGFVHWDGTDDNGNLAPTGIYIVVFDYFNAEGVRVVQKETCVLSL